MTSTHNGEPSAERVRLIEQYASIDTAMQEQERFEHQSAVNRLMHAAGQYGLHYVSHPSDVDVLLQMDAPIDGVTTIDYGDDHRHWETPLLTAFIDGRLEVANALIRRGAAIDAPNYVGFPAGGGFGHTVLHMLASRRDHAGVAAVIEAGADVNRQTTVGWTALHFAADKDDVELVSLLLRSGARTQIWSVGWDDPNDPPLLPIDLAGPSTREFILAADRPAPAKPPPGTPDIDSAIAFTLSAIDRRPAGGPVRHNLENALHYLKSAQSKARP